MTILVYHRVDPVTADRHFTALRAAYSLISLQTYLQARRDNALDRLPPKPLVITIDDGHKSILQLKAVLEKHRMPVTVFLCSGFIDANRRFWFSAPGLSDTERQHLKTVPDDDRLVALRAMGFTEATEFGDRESLNASEITELRHLIDFQSHSVTHPILPACSDEKAKSEILLSRQQLEQLELRVNALAYPNGNYTPRETRYAQDAGYLCGLTMDAGFNARGTPQYALKRLTVKDDCGVDELMVRACGLWEFARFAARPAKGRVPATREWIPAS